jgi:protein-tyrosine phosphatase
MEKREPMIFADLHNHALWGVDDGPKTEQQTRLMLDAAYADGLRTLCLTPHFHPGYFGMHSEQTDRTFSALVKYAEEKYPDLKLYLGNELHYSRECMDWLESGACRTLNGTDYILVDFHDGETERNIVKGLKRLMAAGYMPVLAHAERYRDLSVKAIEDLSANGVRIQFDVQSLFGGYGLGARFRCGRLLKKKLADIAATDAHDPEHRSPQMSRGYRTVARNYGSAYAEALFLRNPLRLLEGEESKYECNQQHAEHYSEGSVGTVSATVRDYRAGCGSCGRRPLCCGCDYGETHVRIDCHQICDASDWGRKYQLR